MTGIHRRYQQTRTASDRRKQDRHIVRLDIRDGHRQTVISVNTVCRRLRSAGLLAHRPHVGHILTNRHQNERRLWAGRYCHWRLQLWHCVLFCVESVFHLRDADDRLREWPAL